MKNTKNGKVTRLAQLTGEKYLFKLDEAHQHEVKENREPIIWFEMIPLGIGGPDGNICLYNLKTKTLKLYIESTEVGQKILDRVPGVELFNEGYKYKEILFPHTLFKEVAKYAKPKTKRTLNLTDEQKKERAEKMLEARRKKKDLSL